MRQQQQQHAGITPGSMVRLRPGGKTRAWTRGLMIEPRENYALVKPAHHKRVEAVPWARVMPWAAKGAVPRKGGAR